MKSPKMSPDVLYVPLYLRSFNIGEKIILTLLIFVSAIAVGSIPLVLSLTGTPEQTTTTIYSSEAELWRILGERK
ncbi:hypothetical protein [Pleurocapsa sp. PCC 7319]|uniref:hypothetical protein n=1 Tax=Pleurocapsa sp. PCC 7319 TaxID=118161 RepID=UPI00036C407D|nr:hypothetical protein [Pleurocapsa sp. PCC 7319]